MNMVTIPCPKCGAEGKLSLVETSYVGPRRCWKCHELFTITIVNNKLTSSEPLSQEEYDRQLDAKKASEGILNFTQRSRQAESEAPKITPERRRNYSEPLKKAEPQGPATASPSQGPATASPSTGPATISPPDRFRTFVPLESPGEEKAPEKPPAPKTPPDRFRTFIPPAT